MYYIKLILCPSSPNHTKYQNPSYLQAFLSLESLWNEQYLRLDHKLVRPSLRPLLHRGTIYQLSHPRLLAHSKLTLWILRSMISSSPVLPRLHSKQLEKQRWLLLWCFLVLVGRYSSHDGRWQVLQSLNHLNYCETRPLLLYDEYDLLLALESNDWPDLPERDLLLSMLE